MLSVSGLSKKYNDIEALNGASFSVEDGEFFALLGPSASGKTTTLRAICGIEPLDSGRVMFDGAEVTQAPVQGRDMAMVFQNFALYPHLTAYENLAYPLRVAGLDGPAVCNRVGEIADLLGLNHILTRKPGTASGGEQQRIAIGRALVRRPRLLLLDEPLTNLDAKLRHDMRAEFKRLHRELGMTVLYATPDQLEALSMGQRIAVLLGGRIAQIGTPDELYSRPKDTAVAAMVGAPRVNLVEAVRRGSDAEPSIELPFGAVSHGPWVEALKGFPVGAELIFGCRPHDVVPAAVGTGAAPFSANVRLSEPLGDVVVLDLEAAGAPLRMVLPEEQGIRYRPGDSLAVAFRTENTQVFARETGTAIR
jgi:multiple sugar transport system ATP-binding protein